MSERSSTRFAGNLLNGGIADALGDAGDRTRQQPEEAIYVRTSNDANAADDGGFFPARPRTVLLKGTRNEIIASYLVG